MILTNIKPGNPAYREEFFGSLALFFRVKNEDEAVAFANDSDFGLGGSVFTKDVERGKRVMSRVDTCTHSYTKLLQTEVPLSGPQRVSEQIANQVTIRWNSNPKYAENLINIRFY